MLNKVVLMGRLVADPELKCFDGVPGLMFRIAVKRNYRVDSTNPTDFISCVAWRSTAEFIDKYFKKGRLIIVEGTLQSRDYVDKEGKNRTSTEVCVEDVYFAGDKPSESPYGKPSESPYGKPSESPYGKPSESPYGKPSNTPYKLSEISYSEPSEPSYSKPSEPSYSKPSDPSRPQEGTEEYFSRYFPPNSRPSIVSEPSNTIKDYDDGLPF